VAAGSYSGDRSLPAVNQRTQIFAGDRCWLNLNPFLYQYARYSVSSSGTCRPHKSCSDPDSCLGGALGGVRARPRIFGTYCLNPNASSLRRNNEQSRRRPSARRD
jgi:hypothetical protein